MLFDKSSVDATWWDGLTAAVDEEELMDITKDADGVTAPGEDGVCSAL